MTVATFPLEAQSWLGRLPSGWQVKPLKHVVQVNPETLPDSTDPDWRMSYADISSVSLGQGIVGAEEISFADAPSRARRLVEAGDTLVSTVRTYLRAITVVREPPENLVASTGFAVLRPGSEIDANFLGYFTTSDAFVNAVVAQSVGVSYPATNASDIVRLPIAFPELDQQQKIAAFLDRKTAEIDGLIDRKRRLLALLAEKRTALITRAVTKGLNPDAPMKDSGIEWLGEIPAHWDIVRIRHVTRKIEQGWSPQCENRQASIGEWGVLKVGCVNGDTYDETENKALPVDLPPKKQYEVRVGDVLVSRANTKELLGSATLVNKTQGKILLCDKLYRLETNASVHNGFLVRVLRSRAARFQYERDATGTSGSMQNIGQDTLKDLRFACPPFEEQKEIETRLITAMEQFGQLQDRIESAVSRLEEYRSALITNAVTGQIKVA